MAARANWKGYLKLSLVSCAVALYPATARRPRVRFNTLNRATGNRVKQQYIDPATGETVDAEDRSRATRSARTPTSSSRTRSSMRSRSRARTRSTSRASCPVEQVDKRYLEAPYYIAPEDKVAQEAFAVIRDAMKKKGKAGIARVVMARRERMMLLEPFGKGIMGTMLRYPYEMRGEEPYFEDIPELNIPKEMRDLAEPYHRDEIGGVRAGEVRGPLRERDDRARQVEGDRQARRGA